MHVPFSFRRPLVTRQFLPSLISVLLLFLGVGCDHMPLLNKKPSIDKPLGQVLPGRWRVAYQDKTYDLTFGTHSEMSLTFDVPPQYVERVGAKQFWLGGNYHLDGQRLSCQFTDGRWSELLARIQGVPFRHVDIVSYTQDELTDGEKIPWKRTGPASASQGEAVDLADSTASNASAVSTAPPTAAELTQLKKLRVQQGKLTATYAKLEAKRKSLDPKNTAAVAAFNKDLADYVRQLTDYKAAAANGHAVATVLAPTTLSAAR